MPAQSRQAVQHRRYTREDAYTDGLEEGAVAQGAGALGPTLLPDSGTCPRGHWASESLAAALPGGSGPSGVLSALEMCLSGHPNPSHLTTLCSHHFLKGDLLAIAIC